MHRNRLLILLLASRSPITGLRPGASGFSVVVFVVAGLVVILSAGAMATRTGLGSLGSSYQSSSREAREAAEAGITTVISELNRAPNRRLLVSDAPLNTWSSANTKFKNPCSSGPPSAAAIGFKGGAEQTIDATRKFTLKSVKVMNKNRSISHESRSDGTTSSPTTPPYKDTLINIYNSAVNDPTGGGNVGYIAITVEGRVTSPSGQVSTAKVTREFQVVPKCCGTSFGTVGGGETTLGNDTRDGDCVNDFPRLLLGAAFGQPPVNGVTVPPGGVAYADAGALLNVQQSGATTLGTDIPTEVLCLNNATCPGVAGSVGGVPIKSINISLPTLPPYPTCPSGQDCTQGKEILARSICETAGSTVALAGGGTVTCDATQMNRSKDYLRVNSAGQVELCNAKNLNTANPGNNGEPILSTVGNAGAPLQPNGIVSGSCDTSINNFCARTGDDPSNYAYHCRIKQLVVSDQTSNTSEANRRQNNTFFIDTSKAPIYLYMNKEWSTSTDKITTLDGWDDGQIQHVHCASNLNDSHSCATKALPNDSPRAMIYSNRVIDVVVGDDGFIRDLFMYLPYGNVILAEDPDASNNPFGLPNFRGSMWVNNLSMGGYHGQTNYTTQIAMPPLSDSFFGVGAGSAVGFPLFDWVARSSSARSAF